MDIDNYIIHPYDKRYGKLGHIFKKYNYDNVVYLDEYYTRYLIPYELVINEYHTGKVLVDMKCNDTNWIHKRSIRRILYESTKLTPQEYFDLLVLHINDKSNRPKCDYCKYPLSFTGRISYGYSGGNYYVNKHIFCSNECIQKYYRLHTDECSSLSNDFNTLNKDYKFRIKSEYYKFLNAGNLDDDTYFYEATCNGRIKFGVTTSELDGRLHHSEITGNPYTSITELLCTTRYLAATLEAIIKFYFEGREYIEISEYNKFKFLFNYYINNKNLIVNPFESDQFELLTSTTIP